MTRLRTRRSAGPLAAVAALLVVLALGAAACGGGGSGGAATPADTITGAGASFPYPLYSKWAQEYNKIKGVKLNYQSIGSGAGIEAIKAKTVDFGASDVPLSAAELDQAGLLQFPMTMGGVVPVVNLDGIADAQLKLDGITLAKVFLGDITTWDDPAIKALNRGLTLPSTSISVVHRSDSSGTTWIFTNYLSAASPEWKSKLGIGKDVAWPVGVGGKGNDGVAQSVKQVTGAIGYVEYAYAKQSGMTTTQLKNKTGAFVTASLDAFTAAAASADWNAPGFAVVLVDEPGKAAWPITGASFILIYKEQEDADRARMMLEFFDWNYKNGQQIAQQLDYVPIPDTAVKLVEDTWAKDVSISGTPIWP